MTSLLDLDPRWRALQSMGGVMDLGFDHPSSWTHAARAEQPFVKEGDDQLASELCRHGEQRFICCTLSLPIRGSEEHVVIALWAEVSHDDFYAYIETFDVEEEHGRVFPTPINAKLASDLGPVTADSTEMTLTLSTDNARPTAALTKTADISLDHLIDLYVATGTLDRNDLSAQ